LAVFALLSAFFGCVTGPMLATGTVQLVCVSFSVEPLLSVDFVCVVLTVLPAALPVAFGIIGPVLVVLLPGGLAPLRFADRIQPLCCPALRIFLASQVVPLLLRERVAAGLLWLYALLLDLLDRALPQLLFEIAELALLRRFELCAVPGANLLTGSTGTVLALCIEDLVRKWRSRRLAATLLLQTPVVYALVESGTMQRLVGDGCPTLAESQIVVSGRSQSELMPFSPAQLECGSSANAFG
jgi:hypothetical protein